MNSDPLAVAREALEWIEHRGDQSGVIPCPQDYAFYIQPIQKRAREALALLQSVPKEEPVRKGTWTKDEQIEHLQAEVSHLHAQLRARPPVPEGWRPIESAPKGEALFWIVPGEHSWATKPYVHMGNFESWSSTCTATHWMPLPSPPSAAAPPAEEGEKR